MPFAPTPAVLAHMRGHAIGAYARNSVIDAQNIYTSGACAAFCKTRRHKLVARAQGKRLFTSRGKPIHGIYSNNSRDMPSRRYPN